MTTVGATTTAEADVAVDNPVTAISPARVSALLVAILGLSVAFATWLDSGRPMGDVRTVALLVSHILTPALAAALCLMPARRSLSRTDRLGWYMLAASAATWSAASMVFAWYHLRLGAPPFPSLADYLYIAYALPGLAGLAAFASSVRHPVSRLHTLFDGLSISAGLLLISWQIVLGDLLRAPGDRGAAWVTTLAYPIADVTVAAVVLSLAWRQARARLSLGLVGLGFLLIAVCDTFYVSAGVNGTLVVGADFWQAGYTTGFLMVGVAALAFESTSWHPGDKTPQQLQGRVLGSALGGQALVYVVLGVALVSLLTAPTRWTEDPTLIALTMSTLVLAGVREALVLADAARLRNGLEGKVRARTDELQMSTTRLRAITETASDAIIVIDDRGVIHAWNAGAEALFECRRESALGLEMTQFMPVRFREAHLAGLARRRAEASSDVGMTVELVGLRTNGEEVPVELSLTGWTHDGQSFFTGILRDISDRKHLEQRGTRERTHMELIQRVAVAANQSGDVDSAFRATLELVTSALDWPVGHAFLVDDDPAAPLRTVAWHTTDPEKYHRLVKLSEDTRFTRDTGIVGQVFATNAPVWRRTSDPEIRLPRGQAAQGLGVESITAFPVRSGERLVGVLEFFSLSATELESDELQLLDVVGTQLGRVVERDQAGRRLTRLALHDALTGLANRVVFYERLEVYLGLAAREGRSVAVLLLDLDGFKEINDSLGHAAGDELLVEIGRRLEAATRRSDTVARLGGDEFAIAMSGVTRADELEAQVARLREALAEPMLLEGRRIQPGASIGVATSAGEESAEVLLRNADLAMYDAKSAGRGRVSFFEPAMHEKTSARLDLESAIGVAVDAGELFLLYQPVVSLRTERVISREALIRWRHPERGVLDPVDLLRGSEGTRQAMRVGEWMLRQACSDAAEWRAEGENDVRLSLKLALEGISAGLVDRLSRALEQTSLPAEAVELQITQPTLSSPAKGNTEALQELYRLGVRVSLEEMDTGDVSLVRLRALPVHTLRLGSHLVRGLPSDWTSCAIVDAFIAMGLALEIDVVAVGVETQEQVGFLKARGCAAVQGPVVGEPRPWGAHP